MLFNSYLFILFFLPVSVAGYFLINKLNYTYGKVWLLGMSLWFYAYFNIAYLPIIVLSVCINFTMNRIISSGKFKKLVLAAAICINLGVLGYFKYYNFFVENINAAFSTDFILHHLILPLGISFFTFQQLSYIIDSYKGKVPDYNFLDYALFVTFFPQLIAGPIVTHDEIVPQYADASKKQLNYENLSRGIMAFTMGLAKKVLIADTFGGAVNWGYGNVALIDSNNALLIMLFYTFQIYFDFSGYCDMATGIGMMFNINITQNFNSPYRALTITDFWKRWHMTLTRFFTRYVYIPLGGSRKGNIRTYVNIFLVFIVSGFWHGANWTFILWGAMHGAFSILTRMCKKWVDKFHPAWNWLVTFLFINVTWIYFRADSISQANQIIGKILEFEFNILSINAYIRASFFSQEVEIARNMIAYIFADGVSKSVLSRLCILLFTMFSLFAVLCMKNTNERINSFKPTVLQSCVSVLLLVYSVISLTGESIFLYYNF